MSKITTEIRRESYEALDKRTLHKHIIDILDGTRLTAHEVAVIMHHRGLTPFPVRQAAAPRLNELVKLGIVEVDGKVYDHETKRTVAAYRLVVDE